MFRRSSSRKNPLPSLFLSARLEDRFSQSDFFPVKNKKQNKKQKRENQKKSKFPHHTSQMASTVPESQQSHQPAVAAEEQQAAAAAAAGAVPAAQTGKFSTSSLWVGDLAPEVAETDLYEAFVSIGPIASFRLLRDAITRRSLEYAYVNYANSLDAERAIEALNFVELKGKPIRIMWSQRDPAVRRSGLGNIFIKNLHPDIDNKALYDTFSVFGNILSCKVATDEHGKSKGYGYVHFETQDAAEMTIKTVNGMLLNGQKVEVERFVPRRERSSGDGSEVKFNNVFVKNLPDSLTEEKLRELFSQFGEITSAMIRRDDSTGSSKMFGFVTFADRAAAKAAVDALNGKPVDGKEIYVGRAMKKAERTAILRREYEAMKMDRLTKMQGVNLYIKNLDESIDDEKLRRLFEEFGSITSCKVMTDDKGVSRGFGFVCFTTADEATRAVTQMNVHMVGSKPLYVSLAQKKEFRQAQLAAQYAQRMPAMPYGPRAIPMGVPPGPGFPPGQMFFPPGPRQPFMYPQAVARGFPPGAFPPGMFSFLTA